MSIDQVALESIDIARLLALIGTDESQLLARLDYLKFSEKDARLLLTLNGKLRAHRDRFNEHFFGHRKELAASQPYFSHPVLFEQFKHTQPGYFPMLSEGRYDEGYVRNRVAVGISHQRIGLKPEWHLSAYSKYLAQPVPVLWEINGKDFAKFEAANSRE